MIYDVSGNKLINSKLSEITLTSEILYSGIGSGIQSAFVTPSGKVWMVTQNDTCYVVEDGTLSTTISLDTSPGHANSAQYLNGYAYVSNWTTPTTINVYTVDDDNETMTWYKDITVPTTWGRSDYFVMDSDEEQIYSLSWNVSTYEDSDYMVLGLWKLGSDGTYVNAYESVVSGITVAQGMCVQDNKMYIVNNSTSYKHIGITIVDLETGEQISEESQTGTITSLETEGIVPLSETTYLVVAYTGAQFLLTESYS